MRKNFLIPLGLILLFVITSCYVQAQVAVIGKVVDENNGSPLAGVTIEVIPAAKTVLSDAEGNFTIFPAKGNKLLFTYIGYQQKEILYNGQKLSVVTLSKTSGQLDEVVVTALGIKREKKRLGYSTQEVNTDALAQSKTTNLGNALTGQVAGLTVNNPTGIFQAPNFSLRGKNPLIVVNGIPIESDLFDFNSNDIENINVLKGATASALYGSRGRNGAILITTKNAKTEGVEVNIGNRTMFTAGFTVFPKTQTQYGNGSEGKYEFWDGNDGGISDGDMIWGPKFGTGVKVRQWNSPIRNLATGEIIPWWGDVAGSIYNDKSKYERVPTDWVYHNNLKDFLGTGIVTENSLSLAYKGEKGQYYFSANHAFQKGQVPNTNLHTGAVTFNSVYKLAKNLDFSANLSYNKVYSPNYPRYGYGPKNHMYTILIWMGDDVNGRELDEHKYRPDMYGYRQANFNYAWYNNVYFAAHELNQKHDRDVLNGQAKLSWQLLPNLNLQGRVNARNRSLFEDMQSPKSYMNYGDSRNGDYKLWNTSLLNVDADFLATYNKAINENVEVTATAGTASLYRRSREQFQSSDGLIQPFLYSLNNTAGPVMANNYLSEKAVRSVYGSVSVDLLKGIFLTATGRQDWSSAIPGKPYFYPSASISTVVSELLQMPASINFLKVNASWAQVQSDLNPYSLYAAYNKDVTFGALPSVNYPAGLFNKDILPEKSTSYEIGISTAMFKNRFSADATYYKVFDENQIINLPTSIASGFTSRSVNGNIYTTNGFELVLSGKPVLNNNVSWSTTLNWSRFVRRLTSIYNDNKKYGNLVKDDRADSYYATVWEKSASGELILDARGLPTRNPFPQNIGHTEPNWRLGFLNTVKVKGFTLNVDIDGVWGGIINSITHEKMWWGGKHPESVAFRDAEYAAGKPVYMPVGVVITGGELKRDLDGNVISDTRTYKPNTTLVNWQTWSQNYPYRARVTDQENKKFANVFDRSFFKLRRLSFGYDIARLINSSKIKSLDMSVFGYNLLAWKKMPYLDPDYGNDDNLQDPSARFIGISFNFKF